MGTMKTKKGSIGHAYPEWIEKGDAVIKNKLEYNTDKLSCLEVYHYFPMLPFKKFLLSLQQPVREGKAYFVVKKMNANCCHE